MAKGGSGLAVFVWKAGRSALNSAAPWLGPEAAQARVLGIQRKLHKWAEDDQERRFSDLHNLVCDPATLMVRGGGCGPIEGRARPAWIGRTPMTSNAGSVSSGSWASSARSCAPG